MVRLALIGGTGGVGKIFCRSAIAAGHEITLLARSPDKVPALFGEKAKAMMVVQGDSTDSEAVYKLCAKADVIISLVGYGQREAPSEMYILSLTARNILNAAKAGQRVIFTTSLGMNGSSSFLWWLLRIGSGPNNMADYENADRMLVDHLGKGGASITVLRPASLDDRSPLGRYHATEEGGAAYQTISRADVASFLLDCLTYKTWDDKVVHLYQACCSTSCSCG